MIKGVLACAFSKCTHRSLLRPFVEKITGIKLSIYHRWIFRNDIYGDYIESPYMSFLNIHLCHKTTVHVIPKYLHYRYSGVTYTVASWWNFKGIQLLFGRLHHSILSVMKFKSLHSTSGVSEFQCSRLKWHLLALFVGSLPYHTDHWGTVPDNQLLECSMATNHRYNQALWTPFSRKSC